MESNDIETKSSKKLRETNERIQIMFVTGFPDFIAEGYEVDALHYLMKPVDQMKFFKTMDKAVSHLGSVQETFMCKQNGETVLLCSGRPKHLLLRP